MIGTIRREATPVPVAAEADVAVVGGGPAGVGAALAAAMAAARSVVPGALDGSALHAALQSRGVRFPEG